MKKIKLIDVLESQKQEQSNKRETSQKQTPKSETKITGGNDKPVQKKVKGNEKEVAITSPKG